MKKRSFFERLTGGIRLSDEEEVNTIENTNSKNGQKIISSKSTKKEEGDSLGFKDEEEEGQLTVDVYQSPSEIVVQAMIAGVQPDNLSIIITRDSVIIKGKREETRGIDEENYFVRELYWGSFSRTISLPCEVETEEAEAIEKHGLLIIKIPKIDKAKKTNLKVKSL